MDGADEQQHDAQYDGGPGTAEGNEQQWEGDAGGDEQQWEQWDDNQQWDAGDGYYDDQGGGEEHDVQDQAIDLAFDQFFTNFMGTDSQTGLAAPVPSSSSSFASTSANRLPPQPLASQMAQQEQTTLDAVNDEAPAPEVPVKRKRGRPPKGEKAMPRHVKVKGAPKFKPTPPPPRQRAEPPPDGAEAAPKRKRGRPFKGTMPPPVRPEPRERSTRIAVKAEEEQQQQQQQLHRLGPYAAFKSIYVPDKRPFTRRDPSNPPPVTHATLPLHIRRALTSNTPWPATILPDEQDAPPRFPEIYSFVAWRKWKPKHDRRLRARLKGWERTGDRIGGIGEDAGDDDREASSSAAGMSPSDDGGRRSASVATASNTADQPPRPPAYHGPWLATISLENSLKIPFRVHPKHARQNYSGLLRLQWRARRTAAARAKAKAAKDGGGDDASKRGRSLDLRDLWVRAVERELRKGEKGAREGGEKVVRGEQAVDGDLSGEKAPEEDTSGPIVSAERDVAPRRRSPVFLRRNVRLNMEREEKLARAASASAVTV